MSGKEFIMDIKRPTDEILKALNEFVDIDIEETRTTRKRSSILKQPRSSDDDQVDFQKRKSFTSKRRVSFAEKFQVVEFCTGNIYDVSGKNSSSDSTSNGNLNSALESQDFKEGINSYDISRNKIEVSSSEIFQMELKEKSQLLLSKKHKISSDTDIEPERKRMNVFQANSFPADLESSNVFKQQESVISEFKKYLFGDEYKTTNDENQDMELTFNTNTSSVQHEKHALMNHDVGTNAPWTDNSKLLDNIFLSSEDIEMYEKNAVSKSICAMEKKSKDSLTSSENEQSLNLESKFSKDMLNVKLLPISLSDVSLKENKENIYIDVKNKCNVITDTRLLKLKEKAPLQKYQHVEFFPELEISSEKHLVTAYAQKQSNFEDNRPLLPEISAIDFEEEVKSVLDKTCISTHPMDLTCVPPEIDVSNLEDSSRDGCFAKENIKTVNENDTTSNNNMRKQLNKILIEDDLIADQLNKTTIEKSHDRGLMCKADKRNCDTNIQETKLSVEFHGKYLETDDRNNLDAMEITCQAHDLTESLLNSTKNDCDIARQDIEVQVIECNNYTEKGKSKNGESAQSCSETKYFSSNEMELTHAVKHDSKLFICDSPNLKSMNKETATVNEKLYNCQNENLNQYKDISQHSFRNLKEKNSVSNNDSNASSNETSHLLQSKEIMQCVHDEMELTCFERDISTENSRSSEMLVVETSKSNNFKRQNLLQDEMNIEDDHALSIVPLGKEQKFEFMHNQKENSNILPGKMHTTNKIENLHSPILDSDGYVNITVNSKTQHFTSDYMELTSKSYLAANEKGKNINPVKNISSTKYFSSFGMDVTCKDASNVTSKNIERQCLTEDETVTEGSHIVNRTQLTKYQKLDSVCDSEKNISNIFHEEKIPVFPKPLLSCDNFQNSTSVNNKTRYSIQAMDLTSKSCSVEGEENKNINSVQNFSKTKHFSSLGMEMTCNMENKSNFCAELISDANFNSEGLKDIHSKVPDLNKKNSMKSTENFNLESHQLKNQQEECPFSSNSVISENIKKIDNELHKTSRQDKLNTYIKLNLDIEEKDSKECTEFHQSNLSISLEASDLRNISNGTKTYSSGINDANVTEDAENRSYHKVAETSNYSDTGIVYAIKRLKAMNQASVVDYNLFKFPEATFLRKQPRGPFSCSRIHLTKVMKDTIRKCSSFNYADRRSDIFCGFNEQQFLPPANSNTVVRVDKTLIEEVEKQSNPSPKCNAHGDTCSNSKIIESSCKTIERSVFIKYCPSPSQNTSSDKNNAPIENNVSCINQSPKSITPLKRSLNFERKDLRSILLSHEENIKNSTAKNDDVFLDIENCSVSLITNTDTFDTINIKLNSKTFNESKSIDKSHHQLHSNNHSVKHTAVAQKRKVDASDNFIDNSRLLIQKSATGIVKGDNNCNLNEEFMDDVLNSDTLMLIQQDKKTNQCPFEERNDQSGLEQKEISAFNKDCRNNIFNEENNGNKEPILEPLNLPKTCDNLFLDKQNPNPLGEHLNDITEITKSSTSNEKHLSNLCEEYSPSSKKISDNENDKNCSEFSACMQNSPLEIYVKGSKEHRNLIGNEAMENATKEPFTLNFTKMVDDNDKCDASMSGENNFHILQGNIQNLSKDINKNSLLNKISENNGDDGFSSDSVLLSKNQVKNICQDFSSEVQNQCTLVKNCVAENVLRKSSATDVNIKGNTDLNKHIEDDIDMIMVSNVSEKLESQSSLQSESTKCQILEVQNPQAVEENCIMGNKMKSFNEDQENNQVLFSNSSKQFKVLDNTKSSFPDVENQNLDTIKDCTTLEATVNQNPMLMFEKQNDNAGQINLQFQEKLDMCENSKKGMKACSSVNDDSKMKNKIHYERSHNLRKILKASEIEGCLWSLEEMHRKQAVFRILTGSGFASYFMYVPLEFTDEIDSHPKITFKHWLPDPDDKEKLGFLLFQYLVSEHTEVFPVSADKLLNKLPKIVECALEAKYLIKDLWFIRGEKSIDFSQPMPRLNVKVINKNHRSYFCLTFPINLKTYPKQKIIPDVQHLEHNQIKKEIILDALKEVCPRKYYLYNMVKVAREL